MNNSSDRVRRRGLAPIAAACLLLSACQPAVDPGEAPLAGARLGGAFTLTDQDGATRTDRDYAGRYRVVYFGYTFCPDVCPVDVQHLMAGYAALTKDAPAKAAKLAPIFVTVDPKRDTPAVLKQFVGAFGPGLTGLTGSEAEIDAMVRRYGAYRRVQPPQPGAAGYMVDHSRNAILYDPAGRPLAIIPTDGDAAATAQELGKWIA